MTTTRPIEALRAAFEEVPAERVALAISGGSDSMALLGAVAALRREIPALGAALVLHVDHGLRKGSDREGRRIAEIAAPLGFEARILTVREAAPESGSLEAWARDRRYALLARAMRDEGCDLLLTAHHRDDQVETLALKLMRGTGLLGLGGMPRQRGLFEAPERALLRPFLDLRRSDLERFRIEAGLPVIEDASNRDLGHRRNLLRHLALGDDGLDAERILRLGAGVLAMRDRLTGMAQRLVDGGDGPRESMVDGRVAMALAMAMGTSGGDWPDVLLGAVIDELAERVGAAPALASAAALRDLRGGDRRVELRRDLWVEVVGGELRVLHAVELPDFEERVLDVGGDEVDVEGLGRFSVSASIVDEIATEGNRQWIAPEAIVGALRLRLPRVGESMQPLGMTGTKLVSDLLREAGWPARLRWRMPVVADDLGLLWIPGGRASERCRVAGTGVPGVQVAWSTERCLG